VTTATDWEAALTEEERAELDGLVGLELAAVRWFPLQGPQMMARDSLADITGYGGAAGGGKTDLIAGLVQDETRHERALIVRREKAQTEGVIQRLQEIVGSTDGFNSQKAIWRVPGGALTEFAGLDNPGDERRWQGRPHDLKAFDEVTEMREQQVRFVMGWRRTNNPALRARVLMTFNPPTTTEGRWVIDFFGPWLDKKHPLYPTLPGALRWAAMIPDDRGGSKDRWVEDGRPFVLIDGEPCYEFDPSAYRPEQIITPLSRTFIPARLTDNPYYMATGYMSVLQNLPEPLRSQMLNGDFLAGTEDDVWQLIPTAWVEAAQARWRNRSPKGEMLCIGADIARGGKDNTILFPRHAGMWFDVPRQEPGTATPNGQAVAGLVVALQRDSAPIAIDVIGVGSSPYDTLKGMSFQVLGVNVGVAADSTDKSGMLQFFNLRTQLGWKLREALDPGNDTGIALPPEELCPGLLRELTTPKWSVQGRVIRVESRDDIITRLKKSPDLFSALCLANMDIPKVSVLEAANARRDVLAYDPFASLPRAEMDINAYDPMARM